MCIDVQECWRILAKKSSHCVNSIPSHSRTPPKPLVTGPQGAYYGLLKGYTLNRTSDPLELKVNSLNRLYWALWSPSDSLPDLANVLGPSTVYAWMFLRLSDYF